MIKTYMQTPMISGSGSFVIESVRVTQFGMLAAVVFLIASLTSNFAAGQGGTVSPPESVSAAKPTATPQKAKAKPARPAIRIESSTMHTRWQEVRAAVGPKELLKLSEQFERDFPFSAVDQQNQALQVCARKTLTIARTAGLSSDFFDEKVGDANYKAQLKSAVRSDKEAAYQLALAYRSGTSGVAANARRAEQWLRFAADLDHARASWELAEIYNHEGLVADAARYEKRAAELGHSIPPRLPSRGY